MNILKSVDSYFKRMKREFPAIKGDSPRSVVAMYFDYMRCFVVYGTVLDQYVRGGFYKLASQQRNESVTYRRISKVYDTCISPSYIHLLENKVDFNRFFSKFISRKWVYAKEMSKTEFCEFCRSVKSIIVKPINLSEGMGIYKIASPTSEKDISDAFESLYGRECIIEECLVSHPQTRFGSTSLNTIRVHSLLDKKGNVHFMKFILRAGVGDTPVDNYCSGGCIYEVDEVSGKIISTGYSKKHAVSDIHPGTNIVMPGRLIPFWNEVKDLVQSAHKAIPQMRFIGWDVAITENGPEIIEGNHHPDYDLLEFVGTRFWWPKFKKYL